MVSGLSISKCRMRPAKAQETHARKHQKVPSNGDEPGLAEGLVVAQRHEAHQQVGLAVGAEVHGQVAEDHAQRGQAHIAGAVKLS